MNVQSSKIARSLLSRFQKSEKSVRIAPADSSIQGVVNSLKSAQRPVLWLGHGIRLAGAVEAVRRLIDRLEVPALVSWAGIDLIDSDHPNVYGRAGVYGQRAANFVLQNSDYILAIGTRMAIPQVGYDLSELARDASIDIVDVDDSEGQKLKERNCNFIHSDAGLFIEALYKACSTSIGSKSNWMEKCSQYRLDFPWIGPEHNDFENFINSYRFMERLNSFFKKNQIVVTDMGTALLCGHQVLKFKQGQRLMTSTGLGEMGFGLPAAIGASFAVGKGEVMCLNCDGGIMMNLQELQTVVHHQLPIKIFIFNNDGYLMIKHTQNALFNKAGYVGTNTQSGVSCPDFKKIAAAFDIPAFEIRTWQECDDVLTQVQDSTGPVICEVFMHPEQLFVPKLSLAQTANGGLISPPLEDLSPLLSLDQLKSAMITDIHEKSIALRQK